MIPAEYFETYKKQLDDALGKVSRLAIGWAAMTILDALELGMPIYSMGNGGSAAIAEHLACDCGKGISFDTHFLSTVHSLPSNAAVMTAIANDIGFDEVFSFQIEQMQRDNGLAIAISSSGNSPNICRGLEVARRKNHMTIALVGFDGGRVLSEELANVIIHVPSHNYGVVEDSHQVIMHGLAQWIRRMYRRHEDVKL